MADLKFTVSKKNIRTMEKDIALSQGVVDIEGKKNEEDDRKESLRAEQERLMEEERRIRSLEEQGKKIAEQAAEEARLAAEAEVKKREEAIAEAKRIEQEQAKSEARNKEAARLADLQEERRRQEEERRRQEAEVKKREEAIAEAKRIEQERKMAEEDRIKKEKEKEAIFLEAREIKSKIEKNKSEKEKFAEEKLKLGKEKLAIEEEIHNFNAEKTSLEENKKKALIKLKTIEEKYKEIEDQEKRVEEREDVIEQQEAMAKTTEEKRGFEKQRWEVESKRQELEELRWPWDKKLQEIERQLFQIEESAEKIAEKEKELLLKKNDLDLREEKTLLNLEAINIGEALKKIEQEKILLEKESDNLYNKFERVKQNLKEYSAKEEKIEQEKKQLDQKEKSTTDLTERRRLEKERWVLAEARRKIEAERWAIEEEKEKAAKELLGCQNKLKSLLDNKEKNIRRLEEVKSKLKGEIREFPVQKTEEKPIMKEKPAEEKKLEAKPVLESQPKKEVIRIVEKPVIEKAPENYNERQERLEVARKRIEALKKISEKSIPDQLPEEKEEREMSSVINRQIEKKEIEKMIEDERKRDAMKERLNSPVEFQKTKTDSSEIKEDNLDEIIRIVPKKPSIREKLFARILIVAVIFVVLSGILTFWYWYFKIRTQAPVIPEESSEMQIPASLFEVHETVVISLDAEEMRTSLENLLKEWQPDNQFRRVVIKKNGRVLGPKEFIEGLSINVPFEFYNFLDNDFTLFIYSQPQGNKLGFVAKVKNRESLQSLMQTEEPNLEEKFKPFLSLLTAKNAISSASFRNARQTQGYTGPDFRFKPVADNDLGICYNVSDYYFVFASSWKSTEEVLGRLDYFLEKKILMKDLKIGDQGNQVELLQKWLSNDMQVYPEKLINGAFGEVTKKAVIRFQEKYSEEILKPQQLKNGTGIVDLSTREKLNQLYSDF